MLNVSQKQVEMFKEWKGKFAKKISEWRTEIETHNPANKHMCSILEMLEININLLEVEEEQAEYQGEEITTERKFGKAMCEYSIDIDVLFWDEEETDISRACHKLLKELDEIFEV